MAGTTGTGSELTREGIEGCLIRFLEAELTDEDDLVAPWDNLGDVMNCSSIGARGAGIQLVDYLRNTYGLSIEELKDENPKNYTVGEVVDLVYKKIKGNK